MQRLPITRAILSVTDKADLAAFGRFLVDHGVELVSTGGTKKVLVEAGLPVVSVSEVTGFPEILGGRVKTLNPKIHGGILADKDNPEHLKTLDGHAIEAFDLVCVNLYDFAAAAAKQLPLKEAVEEIDIGGPAMLRAAAKNFHSVCVIPGPEHYEALKVQLSENGKTVGLEFRREMARAAFAATSRYDALVADYLATNEA